MDVASCVHCGNVHQALPPRSEPEGIAAARNSTDLTAMLAMQESYVKGMGELALLHYLRERPIQFRPYRPDLYSWAVGAYDRRTGVRELWLSWLVPAAWCVIESVALANANELNKKYALELFSVWN